MIGVNMILIVRPSTSCPVGHRHVLTMQCFSVQEFITFDGEDTQEFHLIPIIAVSVAWGTFLSRDSVCSVLS